jgi:putative transposase
VPARSPTNSRGGRHLAILSIGVGIFPNDAAITRLVGAMMLEQNDAWSPNRRYMTLEGLQALSDTLPTRLPAVAR